jgi:hypothetical protein
MKDFLMKCILSEAYLKFIFYYFAENDLFNDIQFFDDFVDNIYTVNTLSFDELSSEI